MKKHPLLLLLLILSACSTVEQDRLNTFIASPTGQAILRVAATTGTNAVNQFAASGKLDGKQVARDALSGASAELRSAQAPGTSPAPSEVRQIAKDAVHEGSGLPAVSRQVAPAVAQAIADAVQHKGAPADLALEAAARGLDQAAAGVK